MRDMAADDSMEEMTPAEETSLTPEDRFNNESMSIVHS